MGSTLLGLLWLSGVWLFASEWDCFSDWAETLLPWRRLAVVLHGILAWCLTLWAGRFVWPHIHRFWSRPVPWRQSLSGWAMAAGLVCLLLSAWGLMYGSADGQPGWRIAHFWPGLWLPLVLFIHAQMRRFKRRLRWLEGDSIKSPSQRPPSTG